MKLFCRLLIIVLTLSSSIPNTVLSQPTIIIGGRDITNNYIPIKSNSDGSLDFRLSNPASNNWNVLNSGFQVTDIPGNVTLKSSLALAVQEYSKLGMMVTFAASDTDTVAFEIFIVAKQTTTPADGIDMILDMDDRDSLGVDGFFVANRVGLITYNSGTRSTRTYMVGKTSPNVLLKGTGVGTTGVTTNAVFIPITTVNGDYISVPILHLWVRNRKGTQLDDITIDLWCKAGE